jgi:hypothetical protein
VNPIASCADQALRSHTHPALKLSELVDIVARRVDRGLDARRLRAILEEYPERFRLLEPWSGPWRPDEAPRVPQQPEEAWVVAVGDPDEPPDTPRSALKLRESVRWLARGIDERSAVDVSRWYAIVLAERAAREAVARRAA